ncbi:MAG: hypothetical protein HFG30_08810 [Eubacterium sp.]|nr:hypothetical protein [Eubacterium sp.]
MKIKTKLMALLIVVVMVFSGCASVKMDVVINPNGSGMIYMTMRLDKAAMNTELKKQGITDAMMLTYWQTLEQSFKEDGFTVRTVTVDGKEYMQIQQLEKVNMATELNFSDNSYITTDTYYTEIDTKDMMGDAGDMGDVSAVVNSVDMSKIAFEVSVTLPNNIVKTNGTISETDKKVVKFNVPLGKKSVLFATTKGNVTLGDVQKKVKAANTIAKPKLKKIKANKLKKKAKSASVTVKWNKVKGAKKYEVTLSTDKKFIKNVKFKTTKKNTITIKKLKKNKKYFVQVVAVKKNLVGVDVYSKPAKKSVKTKK